jgi:hypothetical protein
MAMSEPNDAPEPLAPSRAWEDLEAIEVQPFGTSEWAIVSANREKPLTKQEAHDILVTYAAAQNLLRSNKS